MFLPLIAALTACNYTKRLKTGEYLVEKNKIIVSGDKVSSTDLEVVIKTQPNRKIFGKPRFHLWLYNVPNPEKFERLDSLKTIKKAKKNKRRIERGKKEKTYKTHWRKRFGTWIMTKVGEAPVLLDSSKVRSSRRNLSNYLFKKGYFNNETHDSIWLDTTRKKAYIFYLAYTHRNYTIDTFYTSSEDKKILKILKAASNESLIKENDKLDIDKLDDERARIVVYLKDRGYYDFSKDFISFIVDSSSSNHTVKLGMKIGRVLRKEPQNDSTWFEDNKRYVINNIYIYTDYIQGKDNIEDYDTVKFKDEDKEFIFLYRRKPSVKPKNILQHVYLLRGNYYRSKEVEATYKKLTSLGIYKSININFKTNASDPATPYLDCYIKLKPLKKQTFILEANGTNRAGNLGISGNIGYKNKNVFRGGESLRMKLTGGIEVQQLLANQDQTSVGSSVGVGNFKPLSTFNTIEFGPEISLTIPKFFVPFNVFKFSKNSSPKTVFSASLNYQKRPDFIRGIQDISFAYEWQRGTKFQYYLSPLKVSAVKINPSKEFQERLNTIKDPFLKYSYTDHIVVGSQFQFTYNTQRPTKNKDVLYIKSGVELSGLLLRQFFNLIQAKKDSIGSYEILGIRFAEFAKADVDFRYYINFNKSSQIVYRTAAGIGIPMANLNEALPFEKSFYVGGSNGLRAFRARTIGPGTFYDTTIAFDKIGDIHIEGNIEYRFDLLKIVKGALFYDAGNVWLVKPRTGKPGGEFTKDFYKQLAMGAGIGLRFDLDFFIFRFDFAYPLRQPQLPDGERWFFQKKTTTNIWLREFAENNNRIYSPFKSKPILNIGIGYPF